LAAHYGTPDEILKALDLQYDDTTQCTSVEKLKTKLTDYFVEQHNDLAAHLTTDQKILKGKANGFRKRQAIDLRQKKLTGTPDVTPRDDEATRKAMAKATGNTTTQSQEATSSY